MSSYGHYGPINSYGQNGTFCSASGVIDLSTMPHYPLDKVGDKLTFKYQDIIGCWK